MANSNFETEVIRYLRKKTGSGYAAPVYLGAEQRFVGALRNSSVRNLEEQFLLGSDCLTSSWIDEDGNIRLRKEYFIQDTGNTLQNRSSYIIDTTIYDKTEALYNEDRFYLDSKVLSEVLPGALFDQESLVLELENTQDIKEKYIDTLTLVRKDELKFRDSSDYIELVMTKETKKMFDVSSGRFITKESFV